MSFSVKAAGPKAILPWPPVSTSLHLEWRFFPPIFRPRCSQLRRRRSQDQADGTVAQADRRRRGACFPSMINAVHSNADAAQNFKDQKASSSRVASTRRKASASLQRPGSFCFASSLDTTHVHRKPSRTSGLLLHEQPHRRSDALTDWSKDRCVFLWLCARRVWLILFALQICDIFRSDRGLCCALHVCSLDFIFCITGAGASTCLCIYVHVIVCHIYIPSVSIHTMVPVHIWYIYSLSAFDCESGCAGGYRLVCAVAFYICDVGIAFFFCFCLRLSRVVGSLMDQQCWCWGWNLYLCFSILVFSVYVWAFIYTHVFQLVSDKPQGLVQIRVTQAAPSRVIHVFASVCLSSMYSFEFSFVSSSCNLSLLFTSSFHNFLFSGTWGKTPWDVSVPKYKDIGSHQEITLVCICRLILNDI